MSVSILAQVCHWSLSTHCGPGPPGAQKRHGAQKRESKGSQMTILGGCPVFRILFFVVVICWKIIGFIALEMVPWLWKEIRGPLWRPEDQFGGIWWWSEFPIFPKNMKIGVPHVLQDQALPTFEGISSYGPCTPLGHPRPPKYQPEL